MSDMPGQTTGSTGAPPGPEPGYQPQQPVAYSGSGPSGPRAGFWTRLAAMIVDWFVLAVPTIVLFLILDVGIAYALTLIGVFAYYIVLQGGPTGQTVGKKVLNIRVVVQFLLSGILYLGYLWMLWDREKQTWHDKASRSVVVPVSAYPVQ
jgi:uncharacterized RDD family membrane protein YckC